MPISISDAPLEPARNGEMQVAFATDAGYAPRVEVSAFSVLKHASRPVRIVLICDEEARDAFTRLDTVISHFPNARIEKHCPSFLNQASEGHYHKFLPPAAFGRVLIPYLMTGRALYIDGDTMVRKDIAPLFDIDLEGRPVALALDVLVARNNKLAKAGATATTPRQKRHAENATKRLAGFQGIGVDLDRYFNSGVMVFDCDRLQKSPDLMEACLDFERARDFPTFDQDLINAVFRDQIHELDPIWNAWVQGGMTRRAPFSPLERRKFSKARRDPAIVHYYGRMKPWDRFTRRHWKKGLRWNLAYRQCEAALNRLVSQMS